MQVLARSGVIVQSPCASQPGLDAGSVAFGEVVEHRRPWPARPRNLTT
jgi:hypothetical protein